MPTMKPYIVRQGDYLAQIAFRFGFDAETVWNDPKNAELKELRGDGNVLAPGDLLFIPQRTAKGNSLDVEATNSYTAGGPTVEVTVSLKDAEKRFASCECELQGAVEPKATTDGDGNLTFSVPVYTREVVAIFPEQKRRFRICVGGMDPIDDRSGVRARLAHLGYYANPGAKHDDEEYQAALVAFQCAKGLEPTGEADDDTMNALIEEHGS